jgi:hypothetical protein
VDVDAASERELYVPVDVSDSAVMDTSTDGCGFAKGVSHAIVEAIRSAEERHLHIEVG